MIKSATQKLSKKSKDINILNKAKNKNAIRVLYKKAGQAPEVKIISNVQRLKRAIVHKKLHIVPYENLFIICKHKKPKLNVQQNIFLPLNSIGGDLIVVKIDRKSREFKGLSQEDVIWYSEDLIRKSSGNTNTIQNTLQKNFARGYEKNFDGKTVSTNFENTLINVLMDIELILASILKNRKMEIKNE